MVVVDGMGGPRARRARGRGHGRDAEGMLRGVAHAGIRSAGLPDALARSRPRPSREARRGRRARPQTARDVRRVPRPRRRDPTGRTSATAACTSCESGTIRERTRDHSHVELLLREGLIHEHEMRGHPMRNFVECCLGGDAPLPDMSVTGRKKLSPGDVLLVCTDGAWSGVDDADIASSRAHTTTNRSSVQCARSPSAPWRATRRTATTRASPPYAGSATSEAPTLRAAFELLSCPTSNSRRSCPMRPSGRRPDELRARALHAALHATRRRLGARRVRRHASAVHRVDRAEGAAVPEGQAAGLGHRRVRNAAARDAHAHSARGQQGQAGRPNARDSTADRPEPALGSRSRARSARTPSRSTATCSKPTAAREPRRSRAATSRSRSPRTTS